MTIDQIKKKYSKDIYKQASAAKPLYLSYPWSCCFTFTSDHKPVPIRYEIVGYLRKDYFDAIFPYSGMRKIADYYLKKGRIEIEKNYHSWQKYDAERLNEFILEKEAILSDLSNAELEKVFNEFSRLYLIFWKESIFHDAFDAVGNESLVKLFKKYNISLGIQDINILTASGELSSVQKERLNLINLIQKFRGDLKKMKSDLINHSRRFHWIYNDYAVIRKLSVTDFIKEAKKIIADPQGMKKEKEQIESVQRTEKTRSQLFKSKKIPKELQQFLNILVVVGKWRDERKAYNQMANGFLAEYMREVSKRTGIKIQHMEYLWWFELAKIFSLPKKSIEKLYSQRYKGVFYSGDPESSKIYYGETAQKLFALIQSSISKNKNLIGQPAYPGIVKGRVKIIRSQKEFQLMKKGDILVAPNTRPEYVPIMKIAAAILSEEGGITSHSAIVSRELKIPCIVGMQGVISNLRNGELIEVDASNGVVRKLN